MERRERVKARRRIVVRIGLAGLALGTLATASACIFDKSDYQGGGRLDRGGEAKTAEPTSSSAQPTATTPPTATSDSSVQPDPFDAGDG
ncbi:hypothetical protein BH11MYX4_BH11MYX4_13120 [soil metagenome]